MAKFIIKLIFFLQLSLFTNSLNASDISFKNWLERFKKVAISEGVSESTITDVLSNVKFLPTKSSVTFAKTADEKDKTKKVSKIVIKNLFILISFYINFI